MPQFVPARIHPVGLRRVLPMAIAFLLTLLLAAPRAQAAVVFTAQEQLDLTRLKAALDVLGKAAVTTAVGIAALLAEATKDKAEPTTIPCFNVPPGGSEEEMRRQLQEAEDKINRMDPDDIMHNLELYKFLGRINDASVRQAFRNRVRQMLMEHYKVAAVVDSLMSGLDVTHTLDWVAGGGGETGLGLDKENRSLGGQWRSQERRDALMEAAAQAKKSGKAMNVKLPLC